MPPATTAPAAPTSATLPAKRDLQSPTSTTPAAKRDRPAAEEPLQVVLLNPNATLPKRGTPHSAGFDLSAAEKKTLPPRSRAVVKTGLQIRVPPGCYGRVAPRSGLAVKKFVDVGAGVIDADYRGEVGVVLFNFGEEELVVDVGDRVAQLVLEKISMAPVVQVDVLHETERGAGGFGSTGVANAL